MAGKSGVTIIVAGEDKTGEVFNAVNKHLAEVREHSKETSESLSEMGEVLKRGLETAGIAIGVREVVDGFKEMISSSMELGVEIGHLHEQTGISTENLSALKFMSNETGVSFESLTKGFKKLSTTIYEMDHGSREAAETFAALHVSQKQVDAAGQDMYKIMGMVADQFRTMPDGPTKSALATRLFGRAGMELIPILNEGAVGIDEYRNKAESLGMLLSGETVKRMEELHHSVVDMKGAWAGLALELTGAVAPALKEVASTASEFMASMRLSSTQTLKGMLGASLQGLPGFSGLGMGMQLDAAKQLLELQKKGIEPPNDSAPTAGGGGVNLPDPHASEKLMLADKTAFAEAQRDHAMTLQEEISFWEKRLSGFKQKSAQYLEVLNEINRLTAEVTRKSAQDQKEALRAFVESSIHGAQEQQSESERISDEVTKGWEKTLAEQVTAAESAASAADAQAGATAKIAEATIEHQRLSGAITETEARQQVATLRAQQYAAEVENLNNLLEQLQNLEGHGADTSAKQSEVRNKITGLQADASADALIGVPIASRNNELNGASEKMAHAIFDPLLDMSARWDQQWKQIKSNLLRDAGQLLESQLFKGLFGDPEGHGGKGWDGAGGSGARVGLQGHAGGLLSGVMGLFHRSAAATSSNGGVGAGAGTIATAAASALQTGRTGGNGGIQVVLNNNGAPLQVSQTQQQNDGGEQQVIQVMLKQLETNGPVAQGIMGLIPGL